MRATHGMQANPAPPPADDTETQSELEWVVVGDEGDFGRIIVHNDDVTNSSQGDCLLGLATHAAKQAVTPESA